MQTRRLIAIDPGLTSTGWAMFALDSRALQAVGRVKSIPAQYVLSNRLLDFQAKVERLFSELSLGDQDMLICESPTTMRDPEGAFKVEQVRGIFEVLARSRGVLVPGRVNPRSVQYEVIGLRGKQVARDEVKQSASMVVKQVYGNSLTALGFDVGLQSLQKYQDIVDAILVGDYALTMLEAASAAEISIEEYMGNGRLKQKRKAGGSGAW